jgi:hypothetical protein
MKTVEKRNVVDQETLAVYDQIDGLKVIEEFLLFKGTDNLEDKKPRQIHMSGLEHAAHIAYGLKVNATNKLYVGWHLDKFYKRAGLINSKEPRLITVPDDIFEKVHTLHAQYKTKANQEIE